ncbi:MAG: hypothetical protein QXE80_06010 [Pyrobaculum sp.]
MDKIGIMVVVINGTDVAVATVAVSPRQNKKALDRGDPDRDEGGGEERGKKGVCLIYLVSRGVDYKRG